MGNNCRSFMGRYADNTNKKEIMRKFIKQAFSKQIIAYILAGVILIILDHIIPQFNIRNIIKEAWQYFIKIMNQRVPVFILIILILMAFIILIIIRRKLDKKQQFVLSIIDDREIGLIKLFRAYRKNFPRESRIMTRVFKIINKLERLKLIELGCQTGGMRQVQDELFRITKKGRRHLKKVSERIKDKAEEVFDEIYKEEHKSHLVNRKINYKKNIKEILFILGMLANQLDKKMKKSILRNDYLSKFKDKKVSDFNFVWSILEEKEFIFQAITGYAGGYEELSFYIADEGLGFYHSNRDVLKE